MHVRAERGRAGGNRRARRYSITARTAFALVVVAIFSYGAGGLKPAGYDDFFSDLRWRCIGPFDGGPIASVQGVAGVPGVYTITTPTGGVWATRDGGDTWSSPAPAAAPHTQGDPRRWLDPANLRRIARVTATGSGIEVTLNGGATWMPASHHLPIAEVARLTPHERAIEPAGTRHVKGAAATVSIADPSRPGLVFAGTGTSVVVSFDSGKTWTPLGLNMPVVAINDLDIRGNNLIAATQGQSIWQLDDITPLRQFNAATTAAPAMLFAPADATLPLASQDDGTTASAFIDYYLGSSISGDVTLEVVDGSGRMVYRAQSASPDATDRWLPVLLPLPKSPGHHRVSWDLRFDPPPSPHHRFAQAARSLYEHAAAEPDGPQVLAGAYRVRLTVAGRTYVQPLTVRNDPNASAADLQARRNQFVLSMKAYDAMDIAHRGFLQLVRARAAIRPLLTTEDPDLAKLATDLDARLNIIDGSDWTGLVIPDAPDENPEIEEEEEFVKHPDFVPPKPVSLSKDYDDPTSILGRRFENVTHAPAFAVLGLTLGDVITKTSRQTVAPGGLVTSNYADACQQLAGVLDEWRAINAIDLPHLNAELARLKLPLLPIATNVPAISCTTGTTRR